jgi:signal transduction histidine kinase
MVEDIYAGSTGDVWLNFGRNGIGRFSPKTRQLTPYRHDADDPNSLLPGVVHTIYQNQDVVWLGTSDGLTRLDLVTETFTHLGTDEGLPNTAVVAILPDNNGHLWLSTHKGLVQFDLQTSKAIRSYEVADGLPSNEFNRGAAFGTSNGELFFGSTNGLLVFDPAQIQDNSYHPPVVLTNMIVWHESEPVEFSQLSDQPIYLTEEIVLGPEDEFFQLEFAVLSYAAPAKNQFEYRLDGFDEQWWTNDDVGRPSVSYNHIDPGEYTFRARGTNSDGVWSENEVVLKIVAQPHWYDTRLARAFFVIIGLGTVLGLFANRMRNVQKRAVLLEAQVVERTRELSEQTEQLAVARDNAEAANRAKSTFLSNMSHELRSPLNAILGFSQVMQRSSDLSSENRDNLDIISRSGEHLLTLINQVLDLSKIEAGQAALNETDFDLRQLLRDVENMFRLKAEEQNLQLLFECTHDVPQYMRTDEVKLRQVLINLLNNALKFTDEGGISVRVGQRDAEGNNTRLVFEVEDTGAGIAEEEMAQLFEAFAQTETGRKSQEGTGLGLPISRRFVQLMGGGYDSEQPGRVGYSLPF